MKKLNLNESFISRIWLNEDYYDRLFTTDGSEIRIINFGIPNSDSGADYKDATIKIDNVIYSGDIEIHQYYKDWDIHKHKSDPKYNKVILQVVFWEDEDNTESRSDSKRVIPTVILSKFLKNSIHEIWKEIINNPSPKFKLPCYNDNQIVTNELKKDWLNDVGMTRLVYRSERIKQRLSYLENDLHYSLKKDAWEKVLLEFTFEALGFSKNKSQFLSLSKIIDIRKIKKISRELVDYDSILFGSAGFLSAEANDDYNSGLTGKWRELQLKLKLETMHKSEWHFFRLRPQNFATLRIAYASAFLFEIVNADLLKRTVFCFKNSKNVLKDISELLLNIQFSDYWKHHYDFGKKSKNENPVIGKSRANDIIINVIIPLMYLYSKTFKDEELFIKVKKVYKTSKDKSDNSILKVMKTQLSFSPQNICESQGLIHLHNFYCVKGNCGECKIGEKVFDKFAVNEVLRIILY